MLPLNRLFESAIQCNKHTLDIYINCLGLTSNNLPFNLKLEQQAAVGQYPLSSVAVAAAAAAAANLAHSQVIPISELCLSNK